MDNLRSDFGASISHIPARNWHILKRSTCAKTETTEAKRACVSNERPPITNRFPSQFLVSLPLEVWVIIIQYVVAQVGPFKALKQMV